MSFHTISSGENLWNICKNKFNLNNNTDIANAVNKIAKSNNIKNPNLIFADQKLDLSAMDGFEKTTGVDNPIKKESQQPQTKEYSKEITTAVETKIKNSDIKSLADVDALASKSVNIFSADTKTEEQKEQAYLDYSEKLLSDYYDINKDGTTTTEEFEQKEFESTKKVNELTVEHFRNDLGAELSEEELKQYDNIATRTANLFSKNLDFNGDGKISKEELGFFVKTADGLDGEADGKISGASESAMFGSVTGLNAADEKINAVVNKYLQGQELNAEEEKILESSTVKIRSAMKKAAEEN